MTAKKPHSIIRRLNDATAARQAAPEQQLLRVRLQLDRLRMRPRLRRGGRRRLVRGTGKRLWCPSQAAALFLMAPMSAVRMAPPAPPATTCETTPLTDRLPDWAAARTDGNNSVTTCPRTPPPTRPEM